MFMKPKLRISNYKYVKEKKKKHPGTTQSPMWGKFPTWRALASPAVGVSLNPALSFQVLILKFHHFLEKSNLFLWLKLLWIATYLLLLIVSQIQKLT